MFKWIKYQFTRQSPTTKFMIRQRISSSHLSANLILLLLSIVFFYMTIDPATKLVSQYYPPERSSYIPPEILNELPADLFEQKLMN